MLGFYPDRQRVHVEDVLDHVRPGVRRLGGGPCLRPRFADAGADPRPGRAAECSGSAQQARGAAGPRDIAGRRRPQGRRATRSLTRRNERRLTYSRHRWAQRGPLDKVQVGRNQSPTVANASGRQWVNCYNPRPETMRESQATPARSTRRDHPVDSMHGVLSGRRAGAAASHDDLIRGRHVNHVYVTRVGTAIRMRCCDPR